MGRTATLRIPVFEPAPEFLSAESQQIWQGVIADCAEPGRRTLLISALTILDRARSARALHQQQGILKITESTGMSHINPALKLELQCLQQFAKIWKLLGLEERGGIV